MRKDHKFTANDIKYLQLLAQSFPNISEASTEIINLQAILNLPKGTEHFVADIHGEYEAFLHILKNASGNIQRKVNELFGNLMRESDKRELCTLIYYPDQKLELIKASEENLDDWYHITIHNLVAVCRLVSSKYTHSKVRKALPSDFSYIIQELLHERTDDANKTDYVNVIIDTIISTGRADDFIIAISNVIQRLSIDQLHILGDIFDRGPGAHIILDTLSRYHSWDIQWGNHDVLWMGAMAGNRACQCNVIRLSLRYANMTTLEEGYGINLVPLVTFAMETYKDDDVKYFMPLVDPDDTTHTDKMLQLLGRMHKAIAIIQFKLEGAMLDKHPEWEMADRKLLNNIDFAKGIITLEGKEYPLRDTNFPTVDPADPYKLTPEEEELMRRLRHSFLVSDKLQAHMDTMLSHGSIYGVYNGNLLYHASIPLNEDGTLMEVDVHGQKAKGRDLLNNIGAMVRLAYSEDPDTNPEDKQYAIDYFWYLWCGPHSPLFDKSRMTTFERYFIDDKETHKEKKGAYYTLREEPEVCDMILDEFNVLGSHRHIINGHVPVKVGNGENPIKADGKLMVIDGGFAKAYHDTTGIAGYTLVFHSRGFELVQHEPFTSAENAILNGTDIVSSNQIVELSAHRMRVRDTDKGAILQSQINELMQLLYAYRHGIIHERGAKNIIK